MPDDPGVASEPRKFESMTKGLQRHRKQLRTDVISARDNNTDSSNASTICASISGRAGAHTPTPSRAIENSIQTASDASGTCADNPSETSRKAKAGMIWRDLEAIADPRLLAQLRNTQLHTLDHMPKSTEHLWMCSNMMLPYVTASNEIYTSEERYSERELWSALMACGKILRWSFSYTN